MGKMKNPLNYYSIGGKLTRDQKENLKFIVKKSFENGKKVGYANGCKKRRA